MRLLLTYPRFNHPSGDPPLGVAYLAATLERAGHEVVVFDATFERRPLQSLEATLAEKPFDAIGISMPTSMLTEAAAVARVCAEGSRAPVFAGGPHPTIDPAGALTIDGIDAVMVGEAERTVMRLAEAGGDYTSVPGMAYLREGEVVSTGEPELVENLDELPLPARHLLDMNSYMRLWDRLGPGLRGTSVLASRGCPFDRADSTPALRSFLGTRVRRRSPESIVAELVELKRAWAPDGVMWLDDSFILNRPWVIKLCDMIMEADLGIVWGCSIRAGLADHDMLEQMKRAGLRSVHVRIETGSQRVLDEVYQKGVTIEQVRRTISIAHEMGLGVWGYFTLGAPGETEAELRETVALAAELPLDDATFSVATPLPQTLTAGQLGGPIAAEVVDPGAPGHPVCAQDAVVDTATLNRLRRTAYMRFYLGPRRIWRTARSMLGIAGVKRMLRKLRRF
ncbi:MAG TPA: hypothetical protein DGT21_18040 [Armatimonadetes bacterium]|nr:hypothetical protein [Armatimonadota bacterium]